MARAHRLVWVPSGLGLGAQPAAGVPGTSLIEEIVVDVVADKIELVIHWQGSKEGN
jgi:hypothetical protein